jgi:hypothetical protein
MAAAQQTFLRALNRQLWLWRGGTLLSSLLRVLRLATLALLAAMLADYFLALSPTGLMAVGWAVAGVVLFVVSWELISALALSRKEAAERADRLLGHRRQPVLTAFELQAAPPGAAEPWRQFLVERSLRDGESALAGVRAVKAFPWPAIARQTKLLLLAVAPLAALWLWQPQASRVVLARLRHPTRDLPPYSALQFRVTPQPARVLYGGAIELTVEITGGPVRHPVALRTRKGEYEDLTPCFRQGDTLFSQRLEKVVDPVEFCFAVGRARSAWQPVEILLRPRVALLKLALEPPAYTGLPPTETVLNQETLEGYKGSTARLQLTSNRPLSSGVLTLTPLSGLDETLTVRGRPSGLHTVTFEWKLQHPSRLEVRVEDVQGTPLAEPVQLTQKLIPDRPPEVVLHQPAPYTLATPAAVVAVQGAAADDLALRGVTLVRTVAGYRDRALPLGPLAVDKQFAVKRELQLGQAGVLPGQVLELFLEARDFNPERTGVGASEIARIEIISDAEYAEMVRANETLEQFAERYREVQARFEAFRQTVAELLQEMQKAQPDPDRINALLDQARAQNQQAQEFFHRLAAEFQAYKLEAGWKQVLQDIAERFQGHGNLLDGMNAGNPKLAEALDRLKRDLDLDAAQLGEQMQLTKEFLKAGQVLEHAARFLDILNRQRDLARRLQRRQAEAADAGSLSLYGNQQAEIRQDLRDFASSLQQAAEALTEEGDFDDLRASALEFVEKLQGCGADGLMQQGVSAAEKDNGADTLRYARLAREKLEELLSQCEGSSFGGLCRGQMRFTVREELRESLGQLLGALMRGGRGPPGGVGAGWAPGGGAGDAGDGYSVPSHTRLNTPVVGPPRSVFVPGGQAKGSRGQGGQGGASVAGAERVSPATGDASKGLSGQGREPELVPEKYRKALKRYFSQPEEKP